MSDEIQIVSKVLVYEQDPIALDYLKETCNAHNLIGLRVTVGDSQCSWNEARSGIDDMLRSNIDLGGVLLSLSSEQAKELCAIIHHTRPELPIFLRVESEEQLNEFPELIKGAIAGHWQLEGGNRLSDLISHYVYSMYYPLEFAKSIQSFSIEIFSEMLEGVTVECESPYLVKDHIIYGELLSLIPLESSWYRGYMMLQTTQAQLVNLASCVNTENARSVSTKQDINELLNEFTNMIWGRIKSRYMDGVNANEIEHLTQVPIIVNHAFKHISFGSTEPQLCFKYIFKDNEHRFPPVVIYQRLIFNLHWNPDKFAEIETTVEKFVQSGEIELF